MGQEEPLPGSGIGKTPHREKCAFKIGIMRGHIQERSPSFPSESVSRYPMASKWYSVVSQKLYLAKVLLAQLESGALPDGQPPAVAKQALSQASAEMLLRAQRALLVMVARYHQHKTANPASLAELQELFAYEVPDVAALTELATDKTGWWAQLAELDKALGEPAATPKAVAEENLIAVAADDGADFSPLALERIRSAMASFARELDEQHSEW